MARLVKFVKLVKHVMLMPLNCSGEQTTEVFYRPNWPSALSEVVVDSEFGSLLSDAIGSAKCAA
jgi:hypothetical protein